MSAADEYGVEAAPAELRYTFVLSPFIPADSVVVMKERETYQVIAHDELSDAQILDAIVMFCQKELESRKKALALESTVANLRAKLQALGADL